ncbi:hypothetical protein SNEBB_001643 [Seison nebaliae]|nr:hypothetical protein SNEBB_001643 [Seison nebaliae]
MNLSLIHWRNFVTLILIILINSHKNEANDCNKMFIGSSFVCKCTIDFCDSLPILHRLNETIFGFTSDKESLRFNHINFTFTKSFIHEHQERVSINIKKKKQKIIGFGGALTDASLLNLGINKFQIINSFYSPNGSEYNLLRLPIGGTDFSTEPYTYNDVEFEDFNLTQFKLKLEDIELKIPIIQLIKEIQTDLKIIGSSWSAPEWMKTNRQFRGKGQLKGDPLIQSQYYSTWADYYLKFVNSYKNFNISIWALTAQNEPTDGEIKGFLFNSLGFTVEQQRDFLHYHLLPKLLNNGEEKMKIFILDDNRLMLPQWSKIILQNQFLYNHIYGIAIHWYLDDFVSPSVLTLTHNLFPNHQLLATEACVGFTHFPKSVILGDWYGAENYASKIIDDLNNWVTGWIDWNLILNQNGGPNWANNFVDAPLISMNNGTFYKQPLYYVISHFSKFIRPQSYNVEVVHSIEDFKVVAFIYGNELSILILNKFSQKRNIHFDINDDKSFDIIVTANSITSLRLGI